MITDKGNRYTNPLLAVSTNTTIEHTHSSIGDLTVLNLGLPSCNHGLLALRNRLVVALGHTVRLLLIPLVIDLSPIHVVPALVGVERHDDLVSH